MNPFLEAFQDEILKVGALNKDAIVKSLGKGGLRLGKAILKRPFTALGALSIGAAGYMGAREGLARTKGSRRILARPGRPSRLYYINARPYLGIPRRRSKLQRQRESLHFAKYRERN